LCRGRDKILFILQPTGFEANANFSKKVHLQIFIVFWPGDGTDTVQQFFIGQ
jgi:hypothetical protein